MSNSVGPSLPSTKKNRLFQTKYWFDCDKTLLKTIIGEEVVSNLDGMEFFDVVPFGESLGGGEEDGGEETDDMCRAIQESTTGVTRDHGLWGTEGGKRYLKRRQNSAAEGLAVVLNRLAEMQGAQGRDEENEDSGEDQDYPYE